MVLAESNKVNHVRPSDNHVRPFVIARSNSSFANSDNQVEHSVATGSITSGSSAAVAGRVSFFVNSDNQHVVEHSGPTANRTSSALVSEVEPHVHVGAMARFPSGRLAKCKAPSRFALNTEVEAIQDESKLPIKAIENKAEAKKTRAAGMHRPHTTNIKLHNESLVQSIPLMQMAGKDSNTNTTQGPKYTVSVIGRFIAEVSNDEFKRRRALLALALYFISGVIGQQLLWMLFSRLMLGQREGLRSSFFRETSKWMRLLMICIAFILSMSTAHFVLDYSPEVSQGARSIESLGMKCWFFLAVVCLSSILHAVHDGVERYLNSPLSITETEKRSFVHMICQPTGIEEPVDDSVSLKRAVLRWIWMPFYIITQGTMWLVVGLHLFGFQTYIIVIAVIYFGMAGIGAVFGAHTFGKDMYGGILILIEQPFEVGDLISIEDKGGAGQVPDAVVTGFVERIRLRSTTIRRFDMRACIVPNHYLADKLVSNWKRPRKLIYFQFAIAHRTPISAVKLFSEKALFIIKNHPDVDQNLYIKACFRKLDSGYNFQVVCYNGPETRKQFVQQDIIYRLSTLAHDLGIVITFDEKSVSVQREQLETYYQEESAVNLSADLSKTLPDKKEKTSKPTHAPKGTLLVRVDHLFITGLLPKSESSDWIENCFFVKVSHPEPVTSFPPHVQQGDANVNEIEERTTSFQHVDQKTNVVSWFESLGFQQDPKVPVPNMILLQVLMVDSGIIDRPELLAEESVNIALLSTSSSEPVRLSPKNAAFQGELKISLKFFLGKDLTLEAPKEQEIVGRVAGVDMSDMSD